MRRRDGGVVRTLALRRAAPLLERGIYVGVGLPIGIDENGDVVTFDHPVVVIDLRRVAGMWLLSYRALSPARQASGAVNSRMRPVAS